MSNVLYQCLKDNSRTAPIQVDCVRRHASQRSFWVTSRTCIPFRDAEEKYVFGHRHSTRYEPSHDHSTVRIIRDYRVILNTNITHAKNIDIDRKLITENDS